MAKYSTGSGGSGAGESCELCGSDGDLQTASVAGATLQVCDDCARDHGETERSSSSDSSRDEQDRRRKAAQNTAKIQDAQTGDSSHWEEQGTNYDDDQLPYLVSDYGKRVTKARQDAGLQTEELAAEIDADESDVLAVEQGRATKAGVGGSTISALEQFLDVDLVESR